MFDNSRLLCFHGGNIINTDNDITYNEKSREFSTTPLDISLNKLFRILYDRLCWNILEIEVEITLRMLQTGISQACYVGELICSDGSVSLMFELELRWYWSSSPLHGCYILVLKSDKFGWCSRLVHEHFRPFHEPRRLLDVVTLYVLRIMNKCIVCLILIKCYIMLIVYIILLIRIEDVMFCLCELCFETEKLVI
jgi:hypothetical protein